MLKQRLDFARPQPSIRLNGRLIGGLVLGASLALAAGLYFHYRNLAVEIESSEERIARLIRDGFAARPSLGSREAAAEEVRRVNQAAVQLTIPWDELFSAVESATDRRVSLLSLQPNFARRELRISGEAENFGALREYIERLNRRDALDGLRLMSHEVVSRQYGTQIRFELMGAWRLRT